jgi:hypothetical protein
MGKRLLGQQLLQLGIVCHELLENFPSVLLKTRMAERALPFLAILSDGVLLGNLILPFYDSAIDTTFDMVTTIIGVIVRPMGDEHVSALVRDSLRIRQNVGNVSYQDLSLIAMKDPGDRLARARQSFDTRILGKGHVPS